MYKILGRIGNKTITLDVALTEWDAEHKRNEYAMSFSSTWSIWYEQEGE